MDLRSEKNGLALIVRDHEPGFVIEYVGGTRTRYLLRDEPLRYAAVAPGYAGVHHVCVEPSDPLAIVPPIRAQEARALGTSSEAWCKHFARALLASDASPLARGTYLLRERVRGYAKSARHLPFEQDWLTTREHVEAHAFAGRRAFFDDWYGNGSGRILALRDRPEEHDSRVKAFRKQARDGTLPPLLVYYVSILDAFLLLDGHARLAAALLEEKKPRVIALAHLTEEELDLQVDWRKEAQARYERLFAEHGHKLSLNTRKEEGRRLAHAFAPFRSSATRAKARVELSDEWEREVRALVGDAMFEQMKQRPIPKSRT